jgi:hypothetical protein
MDCHRVHLRAPSTAALSSLLRKGLGRVGCSLGGLHAPTPRIRHTSISLQVRASSMAMTDTRPLPLRGRHRVTLHIVFQSMATRESMSTLTWPSVPSSMPHGLSCRALDYPPSVMQGTNINHQSDVAVGLDGTYYTVAQTPTATTDSTAVRSRTPNSCKHSTWVSKPGDSSTAMGTSKSTSVSAANPSVPPRTANAKNGCYVTLAEMKGKQGFERARGCTFVRLSV